MEHHNQRRRSRAFWTAFWGALAAPGLLYAANTPRITRIEVPVTSARDSMRKDWVRIGEDFGSVITREEAALREQ